MADYQLTHHAEKDLQAIARYTLQHFGVSQARRYRDKLFKMLDLLAEFPFIGSDQSPIKPNVRRHRFHSHVIYYRTDPKSIVILRILGTNQDPLLHHIDS
jgi:toxin ParE1/3/4